MATVTFQVRSKKIGALAPVYIRFVDGRTIDIRVKTELKVIPEAWSNKKGKILESFCNDVFTVNDAKQLDNDLGDLKLTVMKAANIPGAVYTRAWLEKVVNPPLPEPEPKKNAETLTQFIDRYIREAETGTRLTINDKKHFAALTIKGLKGVQEQFRLFQQENGHVNWQDIHSDFYENLVQFFKKKNYRQNTIGRHIKGLKQILNAALDAGLTTNIEHTRRTFKVVRNDIDVVYLTAKELQSVFELDLSNNEKQALARDIFCAGCYTGQRFSDYSRINKSQVRVTDAGNIVLDIRQKKTGKTVIIPVRWELKEILERYDYNLPHIWEQHVNDEIKNVCALAGINQEIEITEIIGGLKVVKKVKKCKLIKTHSARRTGLSLMYNAGNPIADIMQISGHTTEKQLRTYIRADPEDSAERMAKNSFFSAVKMKIV